MKRTLLRFLVCLGGIIVFLFTCEFPFCGVYRFALNISYVNLTEWDEEPEGSLDYMVGTRHPRVVPLVDPQVIKMRITIVSLAVAFVLTALHFLLHKAGRTLGLELFPRLLRIATFYVPIVTVIMLAGMWLDLGLVFWGKALRVGLLFYY